jgi:hypothetical protein
MKMQVMVCKQRQKGAGWGEGEGYMTKSISTSIFEEAAHSDRIRIAAERRAKDVLDKAGNRASMCADVSLPDAMARPSAWQHISLASRTIDALS